MQQIFSLDFITSNRAVGFYAENLDMINILAIELRLYLFEKLNFFGRVFEMHLFYI
ncbi:MAG TPA: hypothetical protein PLL71_11440 [Agriterribacter sp.]|nr:hypothetical protein [Agriterribacter sp.]